MRRAMRASLETAACRCGHVPAEAPEAPRDLFLCEFDFRDLGERLLPSPSFTPPRLVPESRSFVFIERISEVTEVFERERDFRAISERISREAASRTSPLHGLRSRLARVPRADRRHLGPRSTVIVLGDARTNGREPHAGVFAQITERAGAPSGSTPSPACTGTTATR